MNKTGALKRALAMMVAVLLALSPGVPRACDIADELAMPDHGHRLLASGGTDAHDGARDSMTARGESNVSLSPPTPDGKAIQPHAGCTSAAMATPAAEQALPTVGNGSRPSAVAMERFVSFIFAPPEPRPKR